MVQDPWIGKKIGNYQIISLINSGAFGSVYKAEHIHLKERITAIKFLHAYMSSMEHVHFVQEAQFLSSLEHRYILPLMDFGFDEGLPYLIAKYAVGGSLRDRLLHQLPLPTEQALMILSHVGQALQYAHTSHIIHRDLKPENILFNAQGEPLLADFGIATILSSTSVKRSTIIGTPSYMAPEQFRGMVSKESDQYALGCIAYEVFTGHQPFTAPDFIAMGFKHATEPPIPPRQLNAQILPSCEAAILKALAKQRADRHTSIEAFLTALQEPFIQPRVDMPPAPMAWSGWKQPVPDQATEAGQTRGSLSSFPALPPPPESRTKADQSVPGEIPLTPPSSARTIPPEKGPGNHTPRLPALVPRPAQHRSILNRRVLFTFGLVLLVALSGGGLLYFGSFVQRIPTLSPSQVTAATATAAAQTYATGTIRQGIMFGFDAAHTHHNPYEQTLGPRNVSRLTPLWSFTTGNTITSSPTIAGGMVYVGSYDGKLYAFDATCRKNCQSLWSFATGDSIDSSPAVAGGMVYVGSKNYKFYAFDATCRKNCQPLWSFATGNFITSSPAVAGGMVYVGSDDGKLYAFDATCRKNCQPLWNFATGNSVDSSPAVADGIVYVGSANHKLYAFGLAS